IEVMEKNDFTKKGEMPMNLNIEDKHTIESTDSKAPTTPKQPFFIGVAGGTASGKTTVCNMINTQLRDQRVVLISQDSFYYPLSDQTLQKVNEYNFDHPDAFDTKLLLSTMEKLKCGQHVDIPNYDSKNHKRIESARQVHPGDIIILEGILVLHDSGVRNLLNMKIFVDEGSTLMLPSLGKILFDIANSRPAFSLMLPTSSRFHFDVVIFEQASLWRCQLQAGFVLALLTSNSILFEHSLCHYLSLLSYLSSCFLSSFWNSPIVEGSEDGLGDDQDGQLGQLMNGGTRMLSCSYTQVLENRASLCEETMGRRKIEIAAVKDPNTRQVIFSKHRTDSDVRLSRRMQRLAIERGRNVENVLDQIKGMHTLIRDAKATKHDFAFYSDRLIRLVVEHGLGHLPFSEKQVITPTGSVYSGVVFCSRLCGVSVIRSGESMENALRACCKGIKIGKILIHGHGTNGRQLVYEKLPKDIASRHVLLLDPVLATGFILYTLFTFL
ncbi:hypothetical protein V8G54_013282, partial [Vigna mungo]